MDIPIHVASLLPKRYLFLKKVNESYYQWFLISSCFNKEEETCVGAPSPVKAIFEAHKAWKESNFRTIHCGFRYTLPERDEVGSNALFWQMALSYNSSNGRYFDEEVGHLCYVDFASQEAQGIWRKIQQRKPLVTTPASKQ